MKQYIPTPESDQEHPMPEDEPKSIEQQAADMGISVGKLRSMQAYARELARRYPKMSPNRLASKVKQKYNVKTR